MPSDPSSLLAETPAALPDLFLCARALADSLHHGRHPSSRRGASSEFYDYRAFTPGDPARSIDWRAYARSDRLYLRRFHHESQLTITIILDASASMRFAGADPAPTARPKFRCAQELAAAIALIAARQGDRVALVLASASHHQTGALLEPAAGRPALRRVIAALEAARPDPFAARRARTRLSPLPAALRRADSITPRGGLLLILTDALDEPAPLLAALAPLRHEPARNRDAALIQILTPDEMDIGAMTARFPLRLIDPERSHSGKTPAISASDAEEYSAAIRAHIAALRAMLHALGCRHALSLTTRSPIDALREAMAR